MWREIMFSEKHCKEVRDITAIVQNALNDVHQKFKQFDHIPRPFLASVVADVAHQYICECYDETKQRDEQR
jgi:hypothetical protein